MNIKNLKKLVSHLKRQKKSKRAARFNMGFWGDRFIPGMNDVLEEPVCNTQACLAGETCLALNVGFIPKRGGIELKNTFMSFIPDAASTILELSMAEKDRLFYFRAWNSGVGWPEKFERKYRNAKTPVGRLAVAIRRVEHFIETNGAE